MGKVPLARKVASPSPRPCIALQGKDTKEAEGTNVAYAMLQREGPGPLSSAPEPARLDFDPPDPHPCRKASPALSREYDPRPPPRCGRLLWR